MSTPYPHPSSPAARRTMQANRRRDTAPEIQLRRELHRRGLRYRVDMPVRAGGAKARPDLVFTRARVAVFVDGCFWHRCPEHGLEPRANSTYWKPKLAANVARDARNNADLAREGWLVVRVWEHEQVEIAAARGEAAVRGHRS